MASRALTARLIRANSSWLASTSIAQTSARLRREWRCLGRPNGAGNRASRESASAGRRTRPSVPAAAQTRATARSDGAALSARIARSSSLDTLGSSGTVFLSRLRLPSMTASKLLKSCATPPVNWPMLSIFWDSCSCAARLRARACALPHDFPVLHCFFEARLASRKAASAATRSVTSRQIVVTKFRWSARQCPSETSK